MRPQGPIFISYRQSDGTATATDLAFLLRAAGVPVWQDATDLTSGDTERRLEHALTGGLSGAVVVVTPDVAQSGVVRTVEVPALLRLAEEPDFVLAVATTVRTVTDEVDYSAADRLLGRPAGTFSSSKQHAADSRVGMLALVKDIVLFRATRLADHRADGALRISIQTRGQADGTVPSDAHFDVRVRPAPAGRLPAPEGLADLRDTLPLLGLAVTRSAARAVSITGGAHLSVAYALGCALPTTRIGTVRVEGTAADVWTSGTVAATTGDLTRVRSHGMLPVKPAGQPREVLAYVDLLPGSSDAAYTRLLAADPGRFQAWEQIRPLTEARLDAATAGPLIEEVAGRLRSLVQRHDNAHLHLLLRCPYPVAVLLGRLSNTLGSTLYEWDDTHQPGDEDSRPRFTPSLVIKATNADGPITEVLLNTPATGDPA